MREAPVSLNERNFIVTALEEGVRVDGRKVDETRRVAFTFDKEPGTVEVQLGRTRPTEGFFQVNVELSPMAAPEFESGRPSDAGVELSRILERNLRDSKAIDTEALCIVAGSKVFQISLSVHVIDHSGNLADCAQLAASAALLHFKRPDVTIKGDNVVVHSTSERAAVPLGMIHTPVCVTFAFFNDGTSSVVDPSLKEELVSEGTMTFTLNNFKEICAVHKAGGCAITHDVMLQLLQVAKAKGAELVELVIAQAQEASKAKPRMAGPAPVAVSKKPTTTTADSDEEEADGMEGVSATSTSAATAPSLRQAAMSTPSKKPTPAKAKKETFELSSDEEIGTV